MVRLKDRFCFRWLTDDQKSIIKNAICIGTRCAVKPLDRIKILQ